LGEPKREIDLIRLASVLLLLAISVLALVGCLGEEEKGGGETGEETTPPEVALGELQGATTLDWSSPKPRIPV